MQIKTDYLIVGGGIAGASAAYRLADFDRSVVVIEAEAKAPYHASARSAALIDEIYTPNEDVAALARFGSHLMKKISGAQKPKGCLHLFGAKDFDLCEERYSAARARGAKVEALTGEQVTARFPYLRASDQHCAGALYQAPGEAFTIDVGALFNCFRQRVRAMGARLLTEEKLILASFAGGAWHVRTTSGTIRANTLVNAAGAWADEVAARCDVEPKGMTAFRRNVLVSPIKRHAALIGQEGPFVFWDSRKEDLYCDIRANGEVLISPADEQQSGPCDARADPLSIGAAAELFEERTALELAGRDEKVWAGLRTFMPDRRPLIGRDPDTPSFIWSAAYGGFGIEACLSSSLLVEYAISGDENLRSRLESAAVTPANFSVDRTAPSMIPAV